jgi:hypothetical protein
MRISSAFVTTVHSEPCRQQGLDAYQIPRDMLAAGHAAMTHILATGREPVTGVSTQTAVCSSDRERLLYFAALRR